jgi:hypothetical protein
MKTKHTKGNWSLHITEKESIEIWPDQKGLGRICTLTNRNALEEHANAKLIATAPELLDFIIKLEKRMSKSNGGWLADTYHTLYEEDPKYPGNYKKALSIGDKMKQLIKKATK